jgi:hypothetical protein
MLGLTDASIARNLEKIEDLVMYGNVVEIAGKPGETATFMNSKR